MNNIVLFLAITSLAIVSSVHAQEFSYKEIAKRYSDTQLDSRSVKEAKMQGECLVGIREQNWLSRADFDPVAEWTNIRAHSLLEQFPPCTVLIMTEVARKGLIEKSAN